MRTIPFSPPDLTDEEIAEVVDTIRSGWITTGPKTAKFEEEISKYCGTPKTVCLNSATAGLELALRFLGIGTGDEVITTAYTYAATANVILHTGATPVFVDTKKNQFNIETDAISRAITNKTKAVITVDFGGWPCDYDEIYEALEQAKSLYIPTKGTNQEFFDRIPIIADAAHSFGATYKGKKSGNIADFSIFSFHAVKNLTTAEGGAITIAKHNPIPANDFYRQLKLLSLHGQSKDAFAKSKAGGWAYEILLPGYKFNMTDIAASLGLIQLRRFPEMQKQRQEFYNIYEQELKTHEQCIIPPFKKMGVENSYHLFPLRIKNMQEEKRNLLITKATDYGIILNVHFIPVTMHPAYQKLGFNTKKTTPNTFAMYENEITLPLYSTLTIESALYITETIKKLLN